MEPTPTGGSATPGADGDPGGAEHEGRPTDAPAHANVGEPGGPPAPRAPRAAPFPLPRRGRRASAASGREAQAGQVEGRDPEGRLYRAADEETLNRLLTGLRDI